MVVQNLKKKLQFGRKPKSTFLFMCRFQIKTYRVKPWPHCADSQIKICRVKPWAHFLIHNVLLHFSLHGSFLISVFMEISSSDSLIYPVNCLLDNIFSLPLRYESNYEKNAISFSLSGKIRVGSSDLKFQDLE